MEKLLSDMIGEFNPPFLQHGRHTVAQTSVGSHSYMSYDLYFWKQTSDCTLAPDVVIQRFSESQSVDGIVPMDTAAVIARLKAEFPTIAENPLGLDECSVQLVWEHETDGCFIALPCTTYLCIESHGASNEILNRLIDIANEFKCPLYDPQTNERYAG
ncbi:hypothetical protein RB4304 [Rhodopirellula baltica SH 1]|uniref:Uncharacterized protein n=1 Tax=Rhodopirellula baltica (strain DSM 10527 / NCIMB 13988 / SH1) TaxID=243090 RepID=Q7UST6_RHOBA|nr:hypothetical protein RB4304 [Rhodopirellula baltica SH 1]